MKKTAIIGALLLPSLALAQNGNLINIQNLVNSVGRIVASLIPILVAATVVVFFWGLLQYVRGAKESAAAGKSIMIAGIVALAIEVSLWGIIYFAQQSLGIYSNNAAGQAVAQPPVVPGVGNSGYYTVQ